MTASTTRTPSVVRQSDGFTGVVAALFAEARCLGPIGTAVGAQLDLPGLRVRLSGIGPMRAEEAAMQLVRAGAQALLSWGTCGALQPGLVAGDVMLPHIVVDGSGTRYSTDARWRTRVRATLPPELGSAHEGVLVSSAHVWSNPAQKSEGGLGGPTAVDMESAAVGRVAARSELPFLVLRIVADSVDMVMPDVATTGVDAVGRVRPLKFLAGVLRRPVELWRLPELGRDFGRATASLRSIAAAVLPVLAYDHVRPT